MTGAPPELDGRLLGLARLDRVVDLAGLPWSTEVAGVEGPVVGPAEVVSAALQLGTDADLVICGLAGVDPSRASDFLLALGALIRAGGLVAVAVADDPDRVGGPSVPGTTTPDLARLLVRKAGLRVIEAVAVECGPFRPSLLLIDVPGVGAGHPVSTSALDVVVVGPVTRDRLDDWRAEAPAWAAMTVHAVSDELAVARLLDELESTTWVVVVTPDIEPDVLLLERTVARSADDVAASIAVAGPDGRFDRVGASAAGERFGTGLDSGSFVARATRHGVPLAMPCAGRAAVLRRDGSGKLLGGVCARSTRGSAADGPEATLADVFPDPILWQLDPDGVRAGLVDTIIEERLASGGSLCLLLGVDHPGRVRWEQRGAVVATVGELSPRCDDAEALAVAVQLFQPAAVWAEERNARDLVDQVVDGEAGAAPAVVPEVPRWCATEDRAPVIGVVLADGVGDHTVWTAVSMRPLVDQLIVLEPNCPVPTALAVAAGVASTAEGPIPTAVIPLDGHEPGTLSALEGLTGDRVLLMFAGETLSGNGADAIAAVRDTPVPAAFDGGSEPRLLSCGPALTSELDGEVAIAGMVPVQIGEAWQQAGWVRLERAVERGLRPFEVDEMLALTRRAPGQVGRLSARAWQAGSAPAEFVIATPGYTPTSSGIGALHRLCHELNGVGRRAALVLYGDNDQLHPGWDTPLATAHDVQSAIAVYPETLFGDPLGSSRRARWLLNKNGNLGPAIDLNGDEYAFTFCDYFDPELPNLYLPMIDLSITHRGSGRRRGCAVYPGKSEGDDRFDPFGPVHLDRHFTESLAELADFFRSIEVLFSFDTMSFTNIMAVLCGTPVVIVADHQGSREDTILQLGSDAGVAWWGTDRWEDARASVERAFPEYLATRGAIDVPTAVARWADEATGYFGAG